MDGAVIPNNLRGEYHGEFRRGVEGARAGARSVESSYPGNRQLSWTDSHRYPNKTEQAETDAVGSGAPENFTRTESTMGEDKTVGGTDESAHNEPSCTQQDCCGPARPLGKVESTAKEGSLARFRSFRAFCGLGDLLQCPFRHDISCAPARLAAVAESGRTARLRSGKPWCTLGACPYGCLPCVLNSSTI
jgi:hypothetical protein